MVCLKEQFGRRAYFPDENKKFAFSNGAGHGIYALIAEGAPYQRQTGASVPVAVPMAAGPSFGQSTVFQQPLHEACWWLWKEPGAHIEFRSGASSNAANSWGKPEFTRLSQAFIDITDSTTFITSMI